ncbi:COX15/CtaA family protein [Hymenobacter sp. BT770]|uniref:COX15/CtaA family protein n=1 Tax=Hymenobacter sp. BT770 TaxID=2886942 RepID=UPI001D10404F|nr:COX15/CtaA family protein [Hymenobacter sp. BT770]MCC3152669.1 COX15/CtaA family protein [Hymenobacter sp. BT770]MDO3414742.1 COX15/CtaA family protein [Hymenobacter sp. BT770]
MNSLQISPAARRFRFVGILTVIAVYLLILVGGIVRSTGSGMGCPDWPKCFGSWVPPTEASQLPANYKEIYTAQRVAKNQKLARTLQRMGFAQVAGSIFAHPTQYIETDFNPVKTWIEYVNRLLGALIGVFVFLTVVFALPYWRRERTIFWLAFTSFLLTGVQGYLGSLVVSTNLLPVMVTVHMALALVIVALLLYAVDRAQSRIETRAKLSSNHVEDNSAQSYLKKPSVGLQRSIWAALLLTFWQIMLGTQVREQVDIVSAAAGYLGREGWVEKLGSVFSTHRTVSALVLLLNVYVGYELWQLGQLRLRQLVMATLGIIGLEILAGIVLASYALPASVQPVHLTLATVLFGVQFLTLLAVARGRKTQQTVAPSDASRHVVA